MSRAVGVDLGTTTSAVAVLEGGDPTVIPENQGGRTTPSVVASSRTGEVPARVRGSGSRLFRGTAPRRPSTT